MAFAALRTREFEHRTKSAAFVNLFPFKLPCDDSVIKYIVNSIPFHYIFIERKKSRDKPRG